MIKLYLDLLKQLLNEEEDLMVIARDNGLNFLKPSSCTAILILILYIFSPIDLIPEVLLKQNWIGYLDDVAIAIILGGYVYNDVKGVLEYGETKIRTKRIQQPKEPNREDKVPKEYRPVTDSRNVESPVDSNTANNREDIQIDAAGFSSDFIDDADSTCNDTKLYGELDDYEEVSNTKGRKF